MADKIIRFDKEVGRLIAKPCTKDGTPLYLKTDGQYDIGGNKGYDVQNNLNSSNTVCTSPDNLKRIFITCDYVAVHLHRKIKGLESCNLKREYKYSDELVSIIDKKRELYRMSARYGSQMCRDTKGNEIEMVGFGLGALESPYVYQNVEEIYFDWLPLSNMSKDRRMDFSVYLDITGGDVVKAIITLFKDCCGNGVSNVFERYPRLHTIGYIADLAELYKLDHSDSSTFKSWVDYGINGVDTCRLDACIIRVRKGSEWVLKWSIKDGMYVFDRDVLKSYTEELKAAYLKKVEREKYKDAEESRSVKEKLLDRIYEKDESMINTAIKVLLMSNEISKDEIEKEFSEQGKIKYISIINNMR